MAPDPAAQPAHPTRLIWLLGITCFAGALSGRVTDPFVSTMAVEFATSPEHVALLASAYAVPFALVQPILGPFGDALGKRRVIRLSLFLLSLLALAAPFAPSLATLMLLRALTGAAAGGIMPLTLAAIGDAFPIKERQVALSRILVFAIGGQIGGGVMAGLLSGFLGWRGVLGVCGGVALLVSALLVVLPFGGPPEARGRFEPLRAVGRYRHILGMPAARLLFGAVLVEGVLVFGVFPYFAPILQSKGLAGTADATFEAGLAVAAFGAGGFVYAALVKRVLGRIGQSRMVVLGGALAGLALLGFGLAPVAGVFIGAGLVLGVGFYMVHNSIQTRVTEVAPESRGSAVAMHAFHFYVGQSLGPVLMGLLIRGFGAPLALALAAAGILALGIKLGRR